MRESSCMAFADCVFNLGVLSKWPHMPPFKLTVFFFSSSCFTHSKQEDSACAEIENNKKNISEVICI